ncbi:MAG: multicopper oxidase domain-containing protein [Bacteroidetes bacterium]|nr:multicopper oxidase domain-containing protein [Bacteroidota bacterium]
MKRRKFIGITGVGTGVVLFGGTSVLVTTSGSCNMDGMMNMDGVAPEVLEGAFDVPLPVPPSMSANGAALAAQRTTATVFKGKTSTVSGYQPGGILGSTLRASTGDLVNATLQNNLAEPSNLHWHGLLTPADMDGHPSDVAQAGGSLSYSFPILNRAGTYWYHPHPDMKTAKQAYEGLAGFFLVTDAEEQALGLPAGEYELPLVIQDKRADAAGKFAYSPSMTDEMNGLLGESVLVNGVHSPMAEVATRTYRLRILNGSNGRIYNLALSNGASFTLIGTDGGLLAAPEAVASLLLSPGERADVLVNFSGLSSGTEVFLESKTFSGSDYQGKQAFRILNFKVKEGGADPFSLPSSLSTYSPIAEGTATRNRSFDISNGGGHGGHGGGMAMHNINGKSYDESRIDETVTAGATEIWTFDNTEGIDPHPMHLHGALFQVLDRAGGRAQVFPHEKGWKDTVLAMPGEKVRVIVAFGQEKGVYVFHCHNLEHEDTGMMLQMEIG